MDHRSPQRTALKVAALAFLMAAAAWGLSGSASASSYSGVGDWLISANVTEQVVGENVTVNGFVTVNGTLELVNSTLTVMGRIGPINPDPDVPLREAAKVYVNGTFTLTNSTLIFYVPFGGPLLQSIRENSPVGLRVGPTANVTLRDFDNASATTGDQSLITAFGAGAPANGSYSTFAPGSHFTMLNSRAELLGFRGFPGFEFNGSAVVLAGSLINGSLNATVFNGCAGALIANMTFTDVAQPMHLRGGSGAHIMDVNFSGFVLGVQATGAADTLVERMLIHGVIGQIFYSGWPTPGTALALNNTTNFEVRGLRVEGNLTDPSSEYVRMIEARTASLTTLQDVDLGGARGLGTFVSSDRLTLDRVVALGFLDGLSLSNCSRVAFLNTTITGDSVFAMQANGGFDYTFVNYTAGVRNAIWLIGISNVLVDGATLNGTQAGFRAQSGSDYTLRGLRTSGLGTGIWLDSIARLTAEQPVIEFGEYGIELAFSDRIVITGPTLTSAPGVAGRRALFLTFVTNVEVSDFVFTGACEIAGRVVTATNLTLDGFAASTCDDGLDVSGATMVVLRSLFLRGIVNGTALSLSTTNDVTVDVGDLASAGAYAVAMGGVSGARLSQLNGRAAAAGGFVLLASDHVDVLDCDFSNSGGMAVSVFNTTGPVSFTRVNASLSNFGVEILGSPGVVLAHVDASDNRLLGVDLDEWSVGVTLRDLTVERNGADGILIGANTSVFVDGNISSNGGDGVLGGPHVRFDWTIETAGSIRNDTIQMRGNLHVMPGATFEAEGVIIRVDEGTSVVDPLPDERVKVEGRALFDTVTMRPVNATRPYGVIFGPLSVVELRGCDLTGGGRQFSISAVIAQGNLTVSDTSFSAWAQPLSFNSTAADLRRVAFFDNVGAPSFSGGFVYIEDITSDNGASDGLRLVDLDTAEILRGSLRGNVGAGLSATRVRIVTLSWLNITSNLGGGLLAVDCNLNTANLSIVSNLMFGVSILRGGEANFENSALRGNTGPSLRAYQTLWVRLMDVWITFGGGNGIEVFDSLEVTVTGGEISHSGAAGLTAEGVSTVVGVNSTVFDGNAGPQIWLKGSAHADVHNTTFRQSALDAVLLDDQATAIIFRDLVDSQGGRVFARASSFAQVINTSFSSFAAEASGRVDVGWDVRVVVLLQDGSPADGAAVVLRNATGDIIAREGAGFDGVTERFWIMAKTVLAGGREILYTPHEFFADYYLGGSARKNVSVVAYTVVTLRLDTEAPVISVQLDGPAGDHGWFLGATTVTLEASDGGGYGISILWRIAGGAWQEYAIPLDFGSAVFILPDEGDWLVEYYGSDGAGNVGAVESVNVRIDLVPPVAVWLVEEAARHGQNLTLVWGAVDGAGSGVVNFTIDVSFEGGPFARLRGASANGSALFTGEEGTYSFRLAARDDAGRSSGEVLMRGEVVFTGLVRLSVVGADGRAITGATVELVPGGTAPQTGGSVVSFRVPAGHYELHLSAPGFRDRTVPVDVAAGNTTDLGMVELTPVAVANAGGDAGLLPLILVVAAIGAAVAIFVMVRRSRAQRVPPQAEDEWEKL